MKPRLLLWRITHRRPGTSPSREYTVRAPDLDAAMAKLADLLHVPVWTLRPVAHPVG